MQGAKPHIRCMNLLYNSDHYVVMQIEWPESGTAQAERGGYEIVDKWARKGIFIEGTLAQQFRQGVETLAAPGVDEAGQVREAPDAEVIDRYLSGFTEMAQQVVRMH